MRKILRSAFLPHLSQAQSPGLSSRNFDSFGAEIIQFTRGEGCERPPCLRRHGQLL